MKNRVQIKKYLPGQADRKAGLLFIGGKADFSFGFLNDLGNNGKSGTVAFFFFGGKTLLKNESLMLFGNGGAVVADGKGIESAVLADFYRQLFSPSFSSRAVIPLSMRLARSLHSSHGSSGISFKGVPTSTIISTPFFSADSILA